MGGRTRSRTALGCVISVVLAQGCLRKTPLPPTRGYGEPYKGTGETIFVKDSRTDWDITEGQSKKLTSAQALEASGDPEYERRRQLMKAHNENLYRVGKQHRSTAKKMIIGGIVMIAAGSIGGTLLAQSFKETTLTPATADTPEMRTIGPSGASAGFSLLGSAVGTLGIVAIAYAVYGSMQKPPYYEWRVPTSMDRPSYIRQQIEPYNEKLTPANPIPKKRPGGVPDLGGSRPKPGQMGTGAGGTPPPTGGPPTKNPPTGGSPKKNPPPPPIPTKPPSGGKKSKKPFKGFGR